MTTPQELADDWAQMERYASNDDDFAACVLDLRYRLDALVQTVAPANFKSAPNLTQVRSSLVDRVAAKAVINQIAADLELNGYHGAAGWLRSQLSTPAASRQEDFNG